MKEWHPGGKLLGPPDTFVISERALYCPYIHVRDLMWLKATLLQFK